MSENNQFNIEEEKPDHHYRTEIPNIISKLKLSVYEKCAYLTLKEICGDENKCWKTLDSIAEEAGMSTSKLKECLEKLSGKFELLNNQPLILIKKRFKPDGSKDTHLISIVPIWRINGDYFRNNQKNSYVSRNMAEGVSRNTAEGQPQYGYKQDPSQQHVVVVVKGEPPFSECGNVHNLEFTESDFYHRALKTHPDWTTEECQDAWRKYCNRTCSVSDPFKYIEGIVSKTRESKRISQQKQQTRNEKCQKYNYPKQKNNNSSNKGNGNPNVEKIESKSEQQNCKNNGSEIDTSARPLQAWYSEWKKNLK